MYKAVVTYMCGITYAVVLLIKFDKIPIWNAIVQTDENVLCVLDHIADTM